MRHLRLLMITQLGPFVLMVMSMVGDVFKFFVLEAFVILGFTAAYVRLHEPPTVYGIATEWPLQRMAVEQGASCPAHFSDFSNALSFLTMNAVSGGGVSNTICQYRRVYDPITSLPTGSLEDGTLFDWLLAFLFVTFAAVVLLNMLIAMMARTFETVSENERTNFNFLFGQLTLSLQSATPNPPPLYLLSLPFEVCTGLVGLAKCLRSSTERVAPLTIRSHPAARQAKMEKASRLAHKIAMYIVDSQGVNLQQQLRRVERRLTSRLAALEKLGTQPAEAAKAWSLVDVAALKERSKLNK